MTDERADVPYGKVETAGEVGRVIRGHRARGGFSQLEVAGLSGVGVRFLSELERGKPTAELGKVLQVLKRMGLEVRIEPRRPEAR